MSRQRLPQVTDHAVLRYLERSQGVDVETARKHIARAVVRGVEAGACGVLIDGVRFVLRDSVVVTTLLMDMPNRDIDGSRS